MSTTNGTSVVFGDPNEGPWGCFSNLYPAPIVIGEKNYRSVEHYFQSQKFSDNPARATQILNARTPLAAYKLGRNRAYPIRSDWNLVRHDLMAAALVAKFTQHFPLRLILLNSGSHPLVATAPSDAYCGGGRYGVEENRLGHLLNELRRLLTQPTN